MARQPARAALEGRVVGRPSAIAALEELPLRIHDAEGGAVIRCLCGAEAAVMSPGIKDTWLGRSDPSAAGLLRMVLHAQWCLVGQNIAAELRQAAGAR